VQTISLDRKALALSDSKPFTRFWAYGLFGIISPILAFILISLAISQASSWFSWTGNALSDLGVHKESAVLFNSGLIIGGILSIVFAFGVMRFYQNQTSAETAPSSYYLPESSSLPSAYSPKPRQTTSTTSSQSPFSPHFLCHC
jgi:hypothetical protein